MMHQVEKRKKNLKTYNCQFIILFEKFLLSNFIFIPKKTIKSEGQSKKQSDLSKPLNILINMEKYVPQDGSRVKKLLFLTKIKKPNILRIYDYLFLKLKLIFFFYIIFLS